MKKSGGQMDRLKRAGPPKKLLQEMMKFKYLYLFLVPAVVWYILFYYVPMYGLVIAFKNYRIADGIMGSQWVGFSHFVRMFESPEFLRVLRNTVVISGLKLVFVYTSGLVIALVLNEVRNRKLRNLYQDIVTIPRFLSWVIIGSFMMQMLSPSSGSVNEIIKMLGGEPVHFLANTSWFVPVVILSDMWQSAGWNSIIYTAAIAGIDIAMYEAATIDGAGRWRQILYVTLPGVLPVLVVMMIMNVGQILNGGFDQIFNLYSPGVYDVGDIIDTYVYRQGIGNMNYSYSTAVGLFQNVVGLIFVIVCNKIANKYQQVGFW